jgi:hypothetical protein
MRYAFLAVVSILLASCAVPETTDFDPAGQPSHTAVPVRAHVALPLIEVTVNGHPVEVMFDLGCPGGLWLIPEVAEACRAEFTGHTSKYSDAAGTVFDTREYKLGTVAIGSYRLTNVEGREFHGPHGLNINGVVGRAVLAHFRMILDYPSDRLILAALALPPEYDTSGWTWMSIDWSDDGIIAPVTVNGRTVDMIWDSGWNTCVLKPGRVDIPVERVGNTEFARAVRVSIAGRDIGALDFAVMDLKESPGDGFIGSNFFGDHRVLIDPFARMLAFD